MTRYPIRRIAVVGAGNMGSGIAQKIATEGFPVVLVDVDETRAQQGLDRMRDLLLEGVDRGIFKAPQVEAILGRVEATADWDRLADVDLAIEAVFEDLGVKREVFRRLDGVCRPDTLLATNTSSFYVKDLAAEVSHPERVLGLHYFYHPAKNRLVEVVPHAGTDGEATAAAWHFQEAIGKTPIRSADAPGFVVNRYFVPWLNEAVRILEEDIADIPTIEAAAKRAFRIGMGPFELMNVTGVPIALHAAETLGHELGLFYAPAARLRRQVGAGTNWDLSGKANDQLADTVADRLLGVVFYVAAKLVEEKVATVEDTDIGARVGLRWSRGPFQLMQRAGRDRAILLAEAAIAEHGLEVPALLRNAPEGGIPIRLVELRHTGELLAIWIRRPDAMNALNPEVGLQLENALELARTERPKGILVAGGGKAFVAGADIKFFVDNLRRDAFDAIRDFTVRGQRIYRHLSGGEVPVVARAQGLALGGGAELALACDWIAASPKAAFGFPETGIGIYPGLGGTQRLPRRVGLPIAKYLIYTGQVLPAEQALAIGLCDRVAPFEELDAACAALVEQGPAPERVAPAAPLDASWQPVWDFFSRWTVDQILAGDADPGEDRRLAKAVQKMSLRSAAALRLSERLLDASARLSLEEGLEHELAHLAEVFHHPDALEGLSSLIEGRRPAFAAASKV